MKCIICGENKFNSIVNLQYMYPSMFTNRPDEISVLKKQPLSLQECLNCKFVQLNDFLSPDSMYREYWYRSGMNNSMVASLKDVVKKTLNITPLSNNAVMDIGCNDGTMLGFYSDNTFKVGFDPANNLAEKAIKNCSVFINDYFNNNIHFNVKFDIITAIAMFYDVPEPVKFLQVVKNNLAKHGTFVIQMTDLTSMLKANAFDNICHEHLAYYKLMDLSKVVNDAGLEIFDIEYNDVNGASLRAYINHQGTRYINDRYRDAIKNEIQLYNRTKVYQDFNDNIQYAKKSICDFLEKLKAEKKTVFGYGASTKGNTLLQYFDINVSHLPAIMEVAQEKWGKYTVGSNIPIISEEEGFKAKPEYLLVLPWHFINNFVEKNNKWLDSGGKFIVPMPYPAIISKYGYENIQL